MADISPPAALSPSRSGALPAAGASRRRKARLTQRINMAVGVVSIPLFLLVWQLIAQARIVNPILFPAPTEVARAAVEWVTSGLFVEDVVASLKRVATGYLVGSVVGVGCGLLTGRSAFFSGLLGPLFQVLRPIPPIAFVSIVILWFGLSESGKVFLIVWGVFFTVWLSTHLGVQKVDQGLVRAAQMLGTPRRLLVGEVVLLSALPFIVVGLRTAVGISFYTLVAAELAGAFAGIFYRIQLAQQNMQTGLVFAGLAALGLISFIADRCFATLAQRLVWWR